MNKLFNNPEVKRDLENERIEWKFYLKGTLVEWDF